MAKRDSALLLQQWRKTRDPKVADELQRLPSPELTAQLAKVKKTLMSWGTEKRYIKMLPDDPRVTVALMTHLVRPTWPGSSAKSVVALICKRLVSLEDARAIGTLRHAALNPPTYQGASHIKAVQKLFDQTAKALEKAARSGPVESEFFAHSAPASGGSTPASADPLAAVWAKPSDDATRMVVADQLQERGDPYGEFIALQCFAAKGAANESQRRRADELLRKHGEQFAGPIGAIALRTWVWSKGFIVDCEASKTGRNRRFWEEAAACAHWSTVEHVSMKDGGTPVWWVKAWAQKAPLKSLEKIDFDRIRVERKRLDAPWLVTKAPAKSHYGSEKLLWAFQKGLPEGVRSKLIPEAFAALRP